MAVATDCSLRISLALILVLLRVAVYRASRLLTRSCRFLCEQPGQPLHSLIALLQVVCARFGARFGVVGRGMLGDTEAWW